MLNTSNIQYSISGQAILAGINAVFKPGVFNMILGPNGSGKSTFLKICSGQLPAHGGTVAYNGLNIAHQTQQQLAVYRAVMSQQSDLNFPLSVEEIIMMGRYPHFKFSPGKQDFAICDAAIEKLRLAPFRHRDYLTLSGGEKQRVQFARVLAQVWEKPPAGNRFLFLDEPLNNLDINYQQEFLQIAASFAGQNTVLVAVMHDINLAIRYAGHLLFFKEGKLLAAGPPAAVISPALIKQVFDIDVTVISNPLNGLPLVIF